jgi:hypothetical protein
MLPGIALNKALIAIKSRLARATGLKPAEAAKYAFIIANSPHK